MEAGGDNSDVQWAQTNFPQQVDPPAPVPEIVEVPPADAAQPVFLSIEQFEQLTHRLVAEKVAAIEAQYRQQIAALEAQTQELKAKAESARNVPPAVQIALPASYLQPTLAQTVGQPSTVGQAANLAQPALHQYTGGIPLPARPVSRHVAPPPVISAAGDTPKNKFYLQDRRKVSANFDATDHRGVTLGSLNAGTVTNIAVGLQTRELFLNPSLRTPGIGGLI